MLRFISNREIVHLRKILSSIPASSEDILSALDALKEKGLIEEISHGGYRFFFSTSGISQEDATELTERVKSSDETIEQAEEAMSEEDSSASVEGMREENGG